MRSANPMAPLRSAWLSLAPLRQRALLVLLALLLLQAQGLGLWHRVAHGGLPVAAAAAGHVHDAARNHSHHDAHHDAHGVFGHDAGDESGCRLFDSLTAADALLAAPALLALATPPPRACAEVPTHPAGRALRLYQARAPPQA
jgi:hypothetical protein